jgi:two-component system cell cycle response regulator DivK
MYLIGFILRNSGHEVLEARTGEDGVEIALREEPDLIIMDIQLPGIDGIETARRIKKSATKQMPIVALTSYAMTGDREAVLAAGCAGYIEKPIDPNTFINEIEEFL